MSDTGPAAGKRVLLVSSTNVAVDNALAGVVRNRRHQPGELVRVGTPHLAGIASDTDVALTHLVRGRLAEVDRRRDDLDQQLVALRKDTERLAAEEAALGDFDPQADARARALIAATDRILQLTAEVRTALAQRDTSQQALRRVGASLAAAQSALAETADSCTALADIAELQRRVIDAQQAADRVAVDALTVRDQANRLASDLDDLRTGSAVARWRKRRTIAELAAATQARQEAAERAERIVQEHRMLLERFRGVTAAQITVLRARVRFTEPQTAQRITTVETTTRARLTAAAQASDAGTRYRALHDALVAAEAGPHATDEERAMVRNADEAGLPGRHRRMTILREQPSASSDHAGRGLTLTG